MAAGSGDQQRGNEKGAKPSEAPQARAEWYSGGSQRLTERENSQRSGGAPRQGAPRQIEVPGAGGAPYGTPGAGGTQRGASWPGAPGLPPMSPSPQRGGAPRAAKTRSRAAALVVMCLIVGVTLAWKVTLRTWFPRTPSKPRSSFSSDPVSPSASQILRHRFEWFKRAVDRAVRSKSGEELDTEIATVLGQAMETLNGIPHGAFEEAGYVDNLGTELLEQGRAREAEPLLARAVEKVRHLGSASRRLLPICLTNLALARIAQGKWAEAEAPARESVESMPRLRPGDEEALTAATGILGRCLVERGRSDEAAPLLSDTIRVLKQQPAKDPAVLPSLQVALIRVLYAQGKFEEATAILEDVAAGPLPAGDESRMSLIVQLNAAGVQLVDGGEPERAAPVFELAVEIFRRSNLPEIETAGTLYRNKAVAERGSGRLEEAAASGRHAIEILRRLGAKSELSLALAMHHLAVTTAALGNESEAEALYLAAIAGFRTADGPTYANLTVALGNLIRLVEWREKPEDLLPLQEELVGLLWRNPAADPAVVLEAELGLAETLREMGLFARAERLLLDAIDRTHRVEPRGDWTRAAMELIGVYTQWDRAEPGADHATEAGAWRECCRGILGEIEEDEQELDE